VCVNLTSGLVQRRNLTNGDQYSLETSVMHWQRPVVVRLRLKCDGTSAETRFRLSAKRTSPFKSAGASVQPTTGSRGVRISGSNAGYTMFRGSVKSTGYTLHSPVSPSFPLSCDTVCHRISTGFYINCMLSPDRRRESQGALSTLCKLAAFSWVRDSTYSGQ
jgi:hypothetical protein